MALSTGIQIQGIRTGDDMDVGGTGFRGVKVQQMPVEYGVFGIYKKSLFSGLMAAGLAAGATVYSWHWTAAGPLGVVRRVTLDGVGGSATAFTAGFGNFQMVAARTFVAGDSGGTLGALTGDNAKLRTMMGASMLNYLRISSTAALTVGTRTLDTDPMGNIDFSVGVGVSTQLLNATVLFGEDVGPEMPYVCAQNEGFIIRATLPATGTWQFGVSTSWAEVSSY